MRRTEQLTARQEQVLGFFRDKQRQTGIFPTLQEAAAHFKMKSPNAIREHLRLIEKKGAVHRVPGRSRALEFAPRSGVHDPESVRVPLLGKIPAGNPAIAYEDAEALLN